MSLDGIVSLEGNWHLPYFDEEVGREIGAAMSQSDVLLMAGYMNSVRKYVVSTTLQEPLDWNNSTLIPSNVAEEIASLKREEGRNISVSGSATLVRFLLDDGLLDELRLTIPPVIVGRGKHLFKDGTDTHKLELVESKSFSTGVLILTYRTA